MKVLSAIQPSFFPWRGYFDIIRKCDVFIFYDHVQYDKNGWRNRNKILINNQPKWLTIPINHEKIDKRIKDVKIFNSQKNLTRILNTLQSCYGNHPNFTNVFSLIKNIFKIKDWKLLSELNIALTKEVCKLLEISSFFMNSSNLKNIDDKNLNLINLCKKFKCDTYLSGKSAKSYINESLFIKNGIQVNWHTFDELTYKQHKNENFFFEKLSILDYLFNLND